jgi:hypothetical protein
MSGSADREIEDDRDDDVDRSAREPAGLEPPLTDGCDRFVVGLFGSRERTTRIFAGTPFA